MKGVSNDERMRNNENNPIGLNIKVKFNVRILKCNVFLRMCGIYDQIEELSSS